MKRAVIFRVFLTFFLFSIFISCKTKKSVVRQTVNLNDTVIKHEVKEIQLPTKNIFVIDRPCINDSLIISNYEYEIGKLKFRLQNEKGKIIIKTVTDTVIQEKIVEVNKSDSDNYKEVEVKKPYIPKFIIWILIIFGVYIAYRIARIFVPFLKVLPY